VLLEEIMGRTLSVCALALLLPLASAWAGPQRDAVLELLNAYEDVPSQADLAALGDGIDQELMEIADDAKVPSTRRGRALSALQHYRTDDVRTFLEAHVDASDKGILRRKAAWSLAAWGDDAVAKLQGALADDDVQLRIAVAQALGSIGTDTARAALTARLDPEPETAVKDAIRKALGEE
jgi:HEAT repeat protein